MKSRVAIVKCESYETDLIETAIEKILNLLGGITNYIKPNEKVLVKPNLLSPKPPETGVCTHPEIVRAVVKAVKKAKAIPVIGDSPGGLVDIEKVYEISGMKKIATQEGVSLVKFNKPKMIDGIPIAEEALKVDKIISLPKFKTHLLTILTGGIKNLFGVVPGIYKSECHRRYPKPEKFFPILLEVFSKVKPILSIVDGIEAMEGNGPESGELKKVGLILASQDAIALDAVLATVMGISPIDVPTTRIAVKKGLGCANLEEIEILGINSINLLKNNFKLPSTTLLHKTPSVLLNFFASFIKFRPQIDEAKCQGCGICIETCPVKAINLDKYLNIANINYSLCIKCFCCHEVCSYKAVKIKRNIIAKAMRVAQGGL